jgi:hypothetical protein
MLIHAIDAAFQDREEAFNRVCVGFVPDIFLGAMVHHLVPAFERAADPGIDVALVGHEPAEKVAMTGDPDLRHISTSYVERSNLTIRMHIRRFTRLTNAFSKKVENHAHAVALHMMAYNFVRIHKTLRCTPAMAAGVSKRLWDISDIVTVIEEWEARQAMG